MATEGIKEPTPPEVLTEIQGVIAKAKTGDTSVLPQLRAILDRHPGLSRHFGDLGKHAESAWIALAAGNNAYLRETLTREAEARRTQLTRPGAPPVEALLVQRVVACGLQLDYLTAAEANALGAGDTYRQLQYHSKRIERAQRMYLSAMGALVTFQKLVPVPQVVAEIAMGEPVRADVGCESRAQPACVAPPQVTEYLFEEEPAAPERDEREPVRVRVPC